jgi:hypothetical protein
VARLPVRRPGCPSAHGDIKATPKGTVGFTPSGPFRKVEPALARLGRWRRLSRCGEGTSARDRAWLDVAALAYRFARLRAEPSQDRATGVSDPP